MNRPWFASMRERSLLTRFQKNGSADNIAAPNSPLAAELEGGRF
jgi:hypothetical protein